MGAGAICLGLTFARLARLAPATGGPYAYTRLGLRRLSRVPHRVGLLDFDLGVAAGDRGRACRRGGRPRSRCCGQPADRRCAHARRDLGRRRSSICAASRQPALLAEVTTYAKLVPFGAVAIIGLLFIDTIAFQRVQSERPAAAAGKRRARAADDVRLPRARIGNRSGRRRSRSRAHDSALDGAGDHHRRARSTCSERSSSWACVPREQLVDSLAPFSDAADMMWGSWAADRRSRSRSSSRRIGALNGWTLLMGQVPMAAARDGLFPPVFGRLSARGVPAIGIVISAGAGDGCSCSFRRPARRGSRRSTI